MAPSSNGLRRDYDSMTGHNEDDDSNSSSQESERPRRKRLRSTPTVGSTPVGSVEGNESGEGSSEDDTRALHEARISGKGNDIRASANTTPQEPAGPLLPDTYLRSPKNKGRAGNGMHSSTSSHQPGSIVRVSLENFVTYTQAEFFPGPNLNMIIGPNGTGKSTLVCAICLGLGWSTKHLGRAKHISEFVKHGFKTAKIEIELAADPLRHATNPVIKTRISRDNDTADFYLDGKKCPKKHVQTLARSFSIQVDNLCQFLPQDRVAEFATLGPVKLLEATQRAAAPQYMTDWHEELKELGREQKKKSIEQQELLEKLKSLDARQRAQQPDVDRLRQRTTLQTRLSMLEKAKPFPTYQVTKSRYKEANKLYRRAQRDVDALTQQMEPNQNAVDDKKAYLESIKAALISRKRMLVKHDTAVNNKMLAFRNSHQQIVDHLETRKQHTQSIKDARQTQAKHLHNIRKLEQDMLNAPPDVDIASITASIREKTRQRRELDEELKDIKDKIQTMEGQRRQKEQMIEKEQNRKNSLHSQVGQQVSKLEAASKDVARGWQWLQTHRELFSGPVFGPVMIECSVKNKAHAGVVETVIGPSDLLAFTVTNKQDFNTLQTRLFGELSVSADIRNAPDDLPRSPCSTEELRRLGLDCWVLDLLEGPREVLAALCDSKGLESVGFGSGNNNAEQFQALTENSRMNAWVNSKEFSSITRRREYGDHAVSTRVQSVKPARFFTDAPINHELEERIERNIRDLSMDCEHLKEEVEGEKKRVREVSDQLSALISETKALQADKDEKQRAKSAFDGLPTKRDGERAKLDVVIQKIAKLERDGKDFVADTDKLQLKHAQDVVNYATTVESTRGMHLQVLEAELWQVEASSDLGQLDQRMQAEREQLKDVEKERDRLGSEKQALHDQALQLQADCQAVRESCTDEEAAVIEEVQHYSIEQMGIEIDSTKAQLEINTGGNINILGEFEQRARKIVQKQKELETCRHAVGEVREKIDEIRGRWEPELDSIVDKISSAFAENFAAISCAGEVSVYKDDEDYEKWAIQIKVKFRETEALSILDSHRQSGGERSVSTIFYLMAMQSLARAPFRVVDEINQGMDPRNERMVHSRLVSIACEARREDGGGGSQYFLITPKLLTGLAYHANMRIHCIASGEWMPDGLGALNFESVARKALAVRAV